MNRWEKGKTFQVKGIFSSSGTQMNLHSHQFPLAWKPSVAGSQTELCDSGNPTLNLIVCKMKIMIVLPSQGWCEKNTKSTKHGAQHAESTRSLLMKKTIMIPIVSLGK